MKIEFFLSVLLIVFLFSTASQAQQTTAKKPGSTAADSPAQAAVKSSPAYAELLLRKIELESMLEDFLASYTESFPKVKETRYELNLIQTDLARLLSLKNISETDRLTLALGKIMVRRAELQTIAWNLQAKNSEQHPDVLRARRRVASFDKAIGEILP